VALLLATIQVKAQTNLTQVPNLMTNTPTVTGLQEDLSTIFGLHKPLVNFYNDANEFGVSMGVSDGSLNPGLQ
jgi:hypothetical protein